MDTRRLDADVLIAGAGPAGAAAAIACAQSGLRVILAEREAEPRDRPGEALHPGVESVLRQLGVRERLEPVIGARFPGVWVEWGGPAHYEAFGEDETGPWLGMQVRRRDFDALLLDRARELGATVRRDCALLQPVIEAGRVVGAETSIGTITSRLLIDATGAARWLSRKLNLPQEFRSPALIARYGYVQGTCSRRDAAPAVSGDVTGWTWTARVAESVYQWVRLDLDRRIRPRDWIPEELASLTPVGSTKGAEVRWRTSPSAGPGWFMVGDAAATLDPASSHGVLRGLVSGVMAAQTATAVLTRGASQEQAAAAYRRWLAGWFAADVAKLAMSYEALGAKGFG